MLSPTEPYDSPPVGYTPTAPGAGFILGWTEGWWYQPGVLILSVLTTMVLGLLAAKALRFLLPSRLNEAAQAFLAPRSTIWKTQYAKVALRNRLLAVLRWTFRGVGLLLTYAVTSLCLSFWVYPNLWTLTSEIDASHEEERFCRWIGTHYRYFLDEQGITRLLTAMEAADKAAQQSSFVRGYAPPALSVIGLSEMVPDTMSAQFESQFLVRAESGVWYVAGPDGTITASYPPYDVETFWEEDENGRGVSYESSYAAVSAAYCGS